MRQRHETVLGQFRFAPVSDGYFRRTLHIDTAIVSGEGVDGEAFDHAAGFGAPDAGTPTVKLEGARDVHAHCEGGIGPDVLVMVRPFGILLKREFLQRHRFRPVRETGQEPGHSQTDIARVLRVTK